MEPSLGSTGLPSPSDDAPMLGGDALARLLPAAYRKEILPLLRSSIAHDRWNAWQRLKDLGEEGELGLVTFLLRDKSPYIRSRTIAHFRNMGTPLATQALITALQDDESAMVREQAALSLGHKHESITPTVLLNAATHDALGSVRLACWNALLQLREFAVPYLAAAMQDATLRLTAGQLLGLIALAANESVVASMLEILPQLDDSECYEIIARLGYSDSEPVLRLLVNFMRTTGSRYFNVPMIAQHMRFSPHGAYRHPLLEALGVTREAIKEAMAAGVFENPFHDTIAGPERPLTLHGLANRRS